MVQVVNEVQVVMVSWIVRVVQVVRGDQVVQVANEVQVVRIAWVVRVVQVVQVAD